MFFENFIFILLHISQNVIMSKFVGFDIKIYEIFILIPSLD